MRPIETWYSGVKFPSLLEARWAVFFDAAGIPWEHEYGGYKLGDLGETWYLPDFWLPEQRSWVEIKPQREFTHKDARKMKHFEQALEGESEVENRFYIFVGSPYYTGRRHTYKVFVVVDPKALDMLYMPLPPTPTVSELEIVASNLRWVQCPLCHRLQLGLYYHLRDVNNRLLEEQLNCAYCRRTKPREGQVTSDGRYITGFSPCRSSVCTPTDSDISSAVRSLSEGMTLHGALRRLGKNRSILFGFPRIIGHSFSSSFVT